MQTKKRIGEQAKGFSERRQTMSTMRPIFSLEEPILSRALSDHNFQKDTGIRETSRSHMWRPLHNRLGNRRWGKRYLAPHEKPTSHVSNEKDINKVTYYLMAESQKRRKRHYTKQKETKIKTKLWTFEPKREFAVEAMSRCCPVHEYPSRSVLATDVVVVERKHTRTDQSETTCSVPFDHMTDPPFPTRFLFCFVSSSLYGREKLICSINFSVVLTPRLHTIWSAHLSVTT